MREIKFRAFDKRFKKMDFGSGDLLLRINETDYTEPMQYTGLKDKNRREIYEGDIVIPANYSVEEYSKKFFKKDCVVKDLEWAFDNKVIFPEYKIIGNIYENQDLLDN